MEYVDSYAIFFFNDTATTEIYTLSLHDALPIYWIDAQVRPGKDSGAFCHPTVPSAHPYVLMNYQGRNRDVMTLAHELGHRSEEHTSELQSRQYLVCRLLLEKNINTTLLLYTQSP